jgi:hypothetical protein
MAGDHVEGAQMVAHGPHGTLQKRVPGGVDAG